MTRQPVASAAVLSVGYENGVLEVEFKNGGVYQYFGVAQDLYDDLMKSASIGRFIQQRVIGGGHKSQRAA